MNKDLLPIEAIVEKLNLPEKFVERYGAKLKLDSQPTRHSLFVAR